VAPQDLENCGRDFAKLKQSDAKFAGNILLRMVIIDGVINTILGGLILDPAGMHCPSWDDAFVSSFSFFTSAKYFCTSAKAYRVFSELCQFDLIDWHITAGTIFVCHRCCHLRPKTVYLFHDVSSAYNTGIKRIK